MPKEVTQFKPGQSGNPKGRPPGSVSIMSAVKRILKENPDKVEELAWAMINNSIQGNPTVFKQTLDRLEGPVPTVIDDVTKLSDADLIQRAKALFGGDGETGAEVGDEEE